MEAQPPKRAELPKRSRQVAGEPSHPGYAVTVPPLPTRESKGSWSVIVSPPCATMNRKSPPAAAYPRVNYPFGYAAKDGDASRYPSTDTDAVTPHDCAASPQPESNSTNWHCPE